MIHKKAFKIAEVTAFFLLAALMLAGLNKVFLPKWSDEYKSGTITRSFYDLPKDSVDVLILGSSHVICGVDANRMYARHGISAYSCGTEAQPILGSYAWLQEALRFQDVKAVVFDVADVFAQSDEASHRKSFDYMRLSSVKLGALRRYEEMNPDMSFGSYLFPLITYHNRWNELTAEDWNGPDDLALRGFYIRPEVRGMPFAGIDLADTAATYPIPEQNLAVFLDMIALCEQEGIELLLVECPSIDFDTQSHNAIQAIADEHALTFMDFNVTSQWPAIDYAADMADFKHFNVHGAAKATDYISQQLLSVCDLPDRRGDAYLDELDAVYAAELDAALLRGTQDARAYLQALDNESFAVLMATDPDKFSAVDEDLAASFAALGLEEQLNTGEKLGYAAVSQAGEALAEIRRAEPIVLEGQLADGSTYALRANEDGVSITVNGIERATNDPGLNIVVWDLRRSEVVESLSINANLPSLPLIRPEVRPDGPGGPDGPDYDDYDGRSDGGYAP